LVTKWQKSSTKKALVITSSFTSILSMAIFISSYYLHIRFGTLILFFNCSVLRRYIPSHVYAKLLLVGICTYFWDLLEGKYIKTQKQFILFWEHG
jgi:hypothetical protein